MNRVIWPALRGAVGFGLSTLGLVGLLRGMNLLDASAGGRVSGMIFFVLGPFACGVIGGALLAAGSDTPRTAAGFGCGFVPLWFVIVVVLTSLQGGGAPEYGYGAIGHGIAFAIAGGLGGLATRRGLGLSGALVFGLAGALGGYLSFKGNMLLGMGAAGTLGGAALGILYGLTD